MSNKKAFPRPRGAAGGSYNESQQGMYLRDYFAAKAMQGLLSNPEEVGMTWDKVVENSYEIADQMMEARK